MPVVGQPGSGITTDVPGLYDVVINGMGYMLLASLEPNLPFRSHRAIYSWSPTFVDRQNVSGNYGDAQQEFWLTAGQNDWSLGENQRYYRLNDTTSTRKAWSIIAGDPLTNPGQVTALGGTSSTSSALTAVIGSSVQGPIWYGVDNTKIYHFDGSSLTSLANTLAGTITSPWSLASDGDFVYIAGSTGISKFAAGSATSFSSSSSSGAALCFSGNLLYSCDGSTLNSYSSTGTKVNLFTWKDATGTALSTSGVRASSYGGNILMFFSRLAERPQLWQYDGTNTNVIAELPASASGYDMTVLDGVVYLSGCVEDSSGNGGSLPRAVIWFYNSGTIGELWRSSGYGAGTLPAPALGSYGGRLIFTDSAALTINQYDPASGAITTIGGTLADGASHSIATIPAGVLINVPDSGITQYPSGSLAASFTVSSSLIDFESSLQKEFRSIRVDWSGAGSVDLNYQIDSLSTSYTATNAGGPITSGKEYLLPTGAIGNSIGYQVIGNTNAGNSPAIKRVYVRGAPIQDVFRECTYILDLTGIGIEDPVKMNDDQPHMLSGYEQAQNLVTAIESQATFSVTDKLGTFVALADPPNCSIFEWREGNDSPEFPGCYVAQIAVKQVG